MRLRFLRPLFAALALVCILHSPARSPAQDTGEGDSARGAFAGMQRISGVVTAVAPDKLTLKNEEGATYQVVTTPNTRFLRNGATFKLTNLKPGDGVMSAGNLDAPNKTLHAAMVISIDAEQVKKMAAARDQLMANLGKTVIVGRVTAIDLDNARLTLERPDHVAQTISFDESTSFRRAAPGRVGAGEANGMGFGGVYAGMGGARGNGSNNNAAAGDAGESITLADIKVGDNVNGPGAVKNGSFVPTELIVRTPRQRGERRREGQGQASTTTGKPPSN